MRRLFLIASLFLLCCCGRRQAVGPLPDDTPHRAALDAVDSLMWCRPDSAFGALLAFNEAMGDTALCDWEECRFHLLLAELLYKNDYEQSNRAELMKAVSYFDSLAACRPNDAALAFLEARAHYINGVGCLEADSIVTACSEYLMALQLMEDHYGVKYTADNKTLFIGLTFNRLYDLFSCQYMSELAISCAKKALTIFRIIPVSLYSVPITLYQIGRQYSILDNVDSAKYYYLQALELFPDTANSYYRGLRSSMALEDYLCNKDKKAALQVLERMAVETCDDDERLTRHFTIGSIYYREELYDSALKYLQPVFDNKLDLEMRIEVADCLSKIYNDLGEHEKEESYIHFLAQYKNNNADTKSETSKLSTLFQDYTNSNQIRQMEAEHDSAQKKTIRRILYILLPVVIIMFAVLVWITWKKQQKHLRISEDSIKKQLEVTKLHLDNQLKHQVETSRQLHEMEERFKQQKAQTEALKLELMEKTEGEAERINDRGKSFLCEPICIKIRNQVSLHNITTRDCPVDHEEIALDNDTSTLFCSVVNHYFDGLETLLRRRYPRIKAQDILMCYLLLLDLEEKQIAALLNLTYSAVKKKIVRLQEYLKIDEKLADFIKKTSGLQ